MVSRAMAVVLGCVVTGCRACGDGASKIPLMGHVRSDGGGNCAGSCASGRDEQRDSGSTNSYSDKKAAMLMAESRKTRVERHKAILALLNAPGGRERIDADIAGELDCSVRSVRYVRQANPTFEERARSIKALDECGLFPGMYQWWLAKQAGKQAIEIGEKAIEAANRQVLTSTNGGVNSPSFGRLARIEEDL